MCVYAGNPMLFNQVRYEHPHQSDLSIFLKYGSPRAFAFGIGRDFGAYGGAHQADEHIECGRFLEFAQILGEMFAEN